MIIIEVLNNTAMTGATVPIHGILCVVVGRGRECIRIDMTDKTISELAKYQALTVIVEYKRVTVKTTFVLSLPSEVVSVRQSALVADPAVGLH